MTSLPSADQPFVLLHETGIKDRLRELPDNSVDAIVTDPPYGLGKEPDALAMLQDWMDTGHHEPKATRGFMGKKWDCFVPQPVQWRECLRVLKPGGHLIAFAGSRTHDLMGLSIRLAGFEIRDMLAWIHSQGFPKSLNLDGKWEGWGSQLKPAIEPCTLARKPLECDSIPENVLKWHTGALNISACRIGGEFSRYPSNVLHDGSEAVLADFPITDDNSDEDTSASRFFYSPKTCARDRNEGCEHLPDRDWRKAGACVPERENRPMKPSKNDHPTVKPTELMRYLCRLITPPNGIILDPFTGSGSTGKAALLEGFRFIGIEQDQHYLTIARARLEHAQAARAAAVEATDKQMQLF